MMDTDRLIAAMAADGATRPPPMRTTWVAALGVGAVLAAIAFAGLIGPRPDIDQAAQTLRFLFKFVVTLALLATSMLALASLARPGASLRSRLLLLLVAPALLAAAVIAEMAVIPAEYLASRAIGTNAAICLTFIPLIGLGPLAAFLVALRRGAPTRPMLAGAVAGLCAGGLSATFYAAHCTDDSPLFVALWYPLAIALLAALGAIAARRVARW